MIDCSRQKQKYLLLLSDAQFHYQTLQKSSIVTENYANASWERKAKRQNHTSRINTQVIYPVAHFCELTIVQRHESDFLIRKNRKRIYG